MAIVTPADRPKSVRNRCVIEVFGGVLCVVTLLFGLFCRCEGFCHRAESDLFLFSYCQQEIVFLKAMDFFGGISVYRAAYCLFFMLCPFDYMAFAVSGKVRIP